ncbi:ricin-type beta-trefoil lectin domain protein [Streptomyces sp. CC219B]|uniref:ricin-type beta-trefoil lectin domain protein n=1 Tax=Streptomyces sp. CC219B TaxID=3044574 RepID=UPI0024A94F3A|nr:ricin-type beta-trefoil lectin domain protein [Streptomyces sp. CC219B]
MPHRKIVGLSLGLAMLPGIAFVAAPASAAQEAPATARSATVRPAGPDAAAQDWFLLRNRGISKCLANHHPTVFAYRCVSSYTDQHWGLRDGNMLINRKSQACLAMHADGRVFTFRCTNSYRDQRWIFTGVGGGAYLIENAQHRGKCVAAHSDGKVFGFRCTRSYTDQHWY